MVTRCIINQSNISYYELNVSLTEPQPSLCSLLNGTYMSFKLWVFLNLNITTDLCLYYWIKGSYSTFLDSQCCLVRQGRVFYKNWHSQEYFTGFLLRRPESIRREWFAWKDTMAWWEIESSLCLWKERLILMCSLLRKKKKTQEFTGSDVAASHMLSCTPDGWKQVSPYIRGSAACSYEINVCLCLCRQTQAGMSVEVLLSCAPAITLQTVL